MIDDTFSSYNRVDAMCKLLEDDKVVEEEWRSYLWNKVYKREMFRGVVFPIGRGLDEDTSVMHQIFHNAGKVLYYNSEFYYYCSRKGSITQPINEREKVRNSIDRRNARWERYLFIKAHPEYHAKLDKLSNMVVSVYLANFRYIYKHPDLFPSDYPETMRKRLNMVKLSFSKMMPEFITPAKKVEYMLFKHCFPLYRFLAARVKK